jgi:hypothetical protein
MRIGMCSGLHGLGGIQCRYPLSSGTLVVRPLLDFQQQRLEATCTANVLEIAEDPSNKSHAYTRNAVRSAVQRVASIVPTLPSQLGVLTAHIAGLVAEAKSTALQCASKAITLDPHSGHAVVDLAALEQFPRVSVQTALGDTVQRVSGSDRQPSIDAVRRTLDALRTYPFSATPAGPRVIATLGNAVVVRTTKQPKTILIARQPPKAADLQR